MVFLDFFTKFTIVDQFELYINLCNLQQHWLAFLALPTNANLVELQLTPDFACLFGPFLKS
jgi:hypothetical protein